MKNFVKKQIEKNGFACNATSRQTIAKAVKEQFGELPKCNELKLSDWSPIIEYAIKVGGCNHGTEYSYKNAQGTTAVAKVFDLYEIPEGLKNPFLICFSGYMPAAIYTMEAQRAYREKFGKHLPVFATGKCGNKGLFANVFNRDNGLMIDTEAEAYMRIMSQIISADEVRKYQRYVADTDTKGNFSEMYQLAKSLDLNEVTFILCSGQPWYTKRLLAEGMLEFGKHEYADIKVNLVVTDCPLTLDSATPEGHLSELMLGYIAASLGPLTKDTCSLENPDFTKERYMLPEVEEADWSVFEELITYYSNMGWPNYQELLYGVDHETAVYNIIMADLRARSSFSPDMYESALRYDINMYRNAPKCYKKKFFCRLVYLSRCMNDGWRNTRDYATVSYIQYKSNYAAYKDYGHTSWRDKENHF